MIDGNTGGNRRRLLGGGLTATLLAAFGQAGAAGKKRRPQRPVRTAGCAGDSQEGIFADGTDRVAQVFSPTVSGSLRRVDIAVSGTEDPDTDYVVQVVRAPGGVPSLKGFDVIAATLAPGDGAAPGEDATVRATFAGPRLEAGESYAVVLSRPGATTQAIYAIRDSECGLATLLAADGNDPSAPFAPVSSEDVVMRFGVFVAR